MNSIFIKCAGFVFKIFYRNDALKHRFLKYAVLEKKADIVVVPSEYHFKIAKSYMPHDSESDVEFAAIFCALHDSVLRKGATTIHASVVAVDGNAYAFSGVSGIGKSTQAALWKKV